MPKRDSAPVGAPCWVDLFTSEPATTPRPSTASSSAGRRRAPARSTAATSISPRTAYRSRAACATTARRERPTSGRSTSRPTTPSDVDQGRRSRNGGQVIVAPDGCHGARHDGGHHRSRPGASIGVWQPGLHKGFGILGEPGTPTWFELHTRVYDQSVAVLPRRVRVGHARRGRHARVPVHDARRGRGPLAGIMDASAFLPAGIPAAGRSTSAVDRRRRDAWPRSSSSAARSCSRPRTRRTGASPQAADPTGALFKLRRPVA